VRVIGTYHCDDWKQEKWGAFAKIMLRLGARMISRVPHHTIAVSREIYESLTSAGSSVSYIPTGVMMPAARPSRTLLKRWKLHTTPYILVVSRFVRHKSIHDAIEAFKLLKSLSDPRLTTSKLVLTGGGAFTPDYLAELKQRAKGRRDIVFTGYQSGTTLDALFAHATLFLQPSTMEGRSIALLEAMAWGTPVAAADIPETQELLIPHRTKLGLLFRPHDCEAIAGIMRESLLRPKALLLMASAARAAVAKEYNWQTIIRQIDELYLRLSAHDPSLKSFSLATQPHP
jgi:glycosyltransferase involved in cell wall biosynthesis